jgi:hypothetical protein
LRPVDAGVRTTEDQLSGRTDEHPEDDHGKHEHATDHSGERGTVAA